MYECMWTYTSVRVSEDNFHKNSVNIVSHSVAPELLQIFEGVLVLEDSRGQNIQFEHCNMTFILWLEKLIYNWTEYNINFWYVPFGQLNFVLFSY